MTPLPYIDLAIIGIYMLGIFLLGSFFGKYVKGAGDYFVAGRALPFWAIGMSIVVSDIGATDFIATAGAGYTYGIAAANFDWIGSMPAMVLAAFIFVPYYWRSGVYTIPEFLGRRYNVVVQAVHGAIWGIFLIVMLAVMLWLTADTLATTLDADPMIALGPYEFRMWVWLVVFITGIYTFSGGLTAVVMTDVVQMIVMFVGGGALVSLTLWEVGGWGSLQEQVLAMGPEYQDHFTLLLPHDSATPYPWTGIVFGLGLVMATGYMCGNQAIVQRTLGARSEWDAKGGMLFAGFLKSFIPVLIILPGLTAIVLAPGLENGDQAVPTMIRDYLPPGLRGLMFAALFAALMSSVDSYLNSASTIWTTDIYGRISRGITGRELTSEQALKVGRIFTVAFILLGGLFAPALAGQKTMYNFIQTCLSMFQGPVFAILLLGIMWRRTNQWGGMAGLLFGVTFTTILHKTEGLFASEDPFLFVAWWSFVFSIVVTVVVSLMTPKDPDEKVRGLIFGQVMDDGEVQRVLGERITEEG
ncbi:MAG: sodium/solute symporter [Planctomycetaceae bacterium]|jgi:SSS family solute:Na+ symporter